MRTMFLTSGFLLIPLAMPVAARQVDPLNIPPPPTGSSKVNTESPDNVKTEDVKTEDVETDVVKVTREESMKVSWAC